MTVEGQNGSAVNRDILRMGFDDHLLVRIDEIPGSCDGSGGGSHTTDIIDPFEDNDPAYPVLTEYVPIIAAHSRRAQTSGEHAITPDPEVENPYWLSD